MAITPRLLTKADGPSDRYVDVQGVAVYNVGADGTVSSGSTPVATTYGLSHYRNTALSSTAVAVKASAGNVFAVRFTNTNPNAVFVKFYDVAQGSVIVGTTAVRDSIAVPGGSAANPGLLWVTPSAYPLFANFATAITVAVTANQADADTAAPTSAISASILYV